MSAHSNIKPAFGESKDSTLVVEYVLHMTLPELIQRRDMLKDVLARFEEYRRGLMVNTPLHPSWLKLVADKLYIEHSITLVERDMMYAPKSHDEQKRIVIESLENACHG